MTVFVEVLWKSSAALGLALSINVLLRKRSADARRLVLSTAIVAIFAALLASPALPRWTAVAPGWLAPVNPAEPALVPPSNTPPVRTGTEQTVPMSNRQPDSRSEIWNQPFPVIPSIWIAGTLLLLARFFIGLQSLRRLRNASEPVTDASLLACGHVHKIALLQNKTLTAPLTWGTIQPVVLLPSGFELLPQASRDAVLCHELAHIRAYDFLFRNIAEVLRAILWFQPLMWIACRKLREEQELACDNQVLAAGASPSAYAKLLLDWDSRAGTDSLTAIGIAHRCCLKQRLYSLLDPAVRRNRVASGPVFAARLVGPAMAIALAAVSITRATPAKPMPMPRSKIVPPVPKLEAFSPNDFHLLLVQAQTAAPKAAAAPAPVLAPLISIQSTLVLVSIVILDKEGKSIEGLKAGDFVLTEEGAAQTISSLEYFEYKTQTAASSGYYVLSYSPIVDSADANYRRIRIELKDPNPNAKLDYRAGYFPPDDTRFQGTSGAVPVVLEPGTTAPSVISSQKPEYSAQGRQAKYSGNVTLMVEVNTTGLASDIYVTRALGMGLEEQAIEAIRHWRFQPGTKDGKPVNMRTQVEVRFRLL